MYERIFKEYFWDSRSKALSYAHKFEWDDCSSEIPGRFLFQKKNPRLSMKLDTESWIGVFKKTTCLFISRPTTIRNEWSIRCTPMIQRTGNSLIIFWCVKMALITLSKHSIVRSGQQREPSWIYREGESALFLKQNCWSTRQEIQRRRRAWRSDSRKPPCWIHERRVSERSQPWKPVGERCVMFFFV